MNFHLVTLGLLRPNELKFDDFITLKKLNKNRKNQM
jgi:hypothetical protein